ncbi:hypothetical protein GCM10027214_27590 [Stenotrophomonas tumulicola]
MTDALISAPLRETVRWPTIRRHGGLGTHGPACSVDARKASGNRWGGPAAAKSRLPALRAGNGSCAIAGKNGRHGYVSSPPGQGLMRQIQGTAGPSPGLPPASVYRQG